ncbi:hypothetical protein LOTGIDRAFT_235122 [Lottia gigantea]|uniref:Uncharacterized protein n=1 Tax=Lottia gigantea TaxID=225164 RepID=V4BF34_LOTGI|nr:hypothetical protein LOTGIDRAFT_235122 [Lottia gigantea]ESO87479.1 hypothetical protein LOTGIDRAFT_235122 [Lottia gigantea]
MRPGLHGNLLRNSRQRSHRLNSNRPHTFSLSRLLMMVFVGAIMFIPGLTLTVIGLQKAAKNELQPAERVMYKVVGPSLCVLGLGTLLAAGIYYCCYAVGDDGRRKNNSHHAALVSQESERHHHHHHHHHGNGASSSQRRHSNTPSRTEEDHENRVPLAYIDEDISSPTIQIDNVSDNQKLQPGLDIPEVRISPCSSYHVMRIIVLCTVFEQGRLLKAHIDIVYPIGQFCQVNVKYMIQN